MKKRMMKIMRWKMTNRCKANIIMGLAVVFLLSVAFLLSSPAILLSAAENSGEGIVFEDADAPAKLPSGVFAERGQVDTSLQFVKEDGTFKYDGKYYDREVAPLPEGQVDVDFRDTDLRDALSVLATKMGVNILVCEDPRDITFQVRGVTPKTAFEYLIVKEDLHYIQKGNLYIVGEESNLHDRFFNQMMLKRFDLDYITAERLEGALTSDLDIPLKSVIFSEANPYTMWVQATALSLSKIKEVKDELDIVENVAGVAGPFASPEPDMGGVMGARVPVASASGENATARLDSQRKVLAELTGVSAGRMSISGNLSGDSDNPHHILWVEESPAKVEAVLNMVEKIHIIDDPGLPEDLPDEFYLNRKASE